MVEELELWCSEAGREGTNLSNFSQSVSDRPTSLLLKVLVASFTTGISPDPFLVTMSIRPRPSRKFAVVSLMECLDGEEPLMKGFDTSARLLAASDSFNIFDQGDPWQDLDTSSRR